MSSEATIAPPDGNVADEGCSDVLRTNVEPAKNGLRAKQVIADCVTVLGEILVRGDELGPDDHEDARRACLHAAATLCADEADREMILGISRALDELSQLKRDMATIQARIDEARNRTGEVIP
jgi:hypothetical protein